MLRFSRSFPYYLLSDIAPVSLNLPTAPIKFTSAHSRSTLSPKSRGVRRREPSPMMQRVVCRLPIAFQPHKQAPDYLLCYVRETLDCGHIVHTFPFIDPLVAVRRNCHKCDEEIAKKKPAASVTTAGKNKIGGKEERKQIS